MNWALVIDDIVIERTEIDPAGRFHESLIWVECTESVVPGWTYMNGKFSAPVVTTPSFSWADFQAQAQAALSKSDEVILRCFESEVAVPSEWVTYCSSLREIIGGGCRRRERSSG